MSTKKPTLGERLADAEDEVMNLRAAIIGADVKIERLSRYGERLNIELAMANARLTDWRQAAIDAGGAEALC